MPKYMPPRRVNTSSRIEPVDRIRIRLRLRVALGEGDAHLHRPAGAHRVAAGEEALAQRHAADEVLEELAQLLLGPRRVDALAVAAAVGRAQLQRGVHQQPRHAGALGAAVDLLPGDLRQAGHRGSARKLDSCSVTASTAQRFAAARARCAARRTRRRCRPPSPARSAHARGQQRDDLRAHVRRARRRSRRLLRLDRAAGERGERDERQRSERAACASHGRRFCGPATCPSGVGPRSGAHSPETTCRRASKQSGSIAVPTVAAIISSVFAIGTAAAVRAVGGDGVEDVGGGDDPCLERDLVGAQAARVAGAVEPLVVRRRRRGRARRTHRCARGWPRCAGRAARTAAHSASSSWPGLSSTALLTPSLPTSCSRAPRRSQRRRASERPTRRAMASTYAATRALCPLVNGLLLSTIWPKAAAMSSR